MTKEVAEMNQAVANVPAVQTIDFPGLEDMPTSFIPVPRIKLVQANSQEVALDDGQEARKGTFYYEDRQQAEDTLKVAILAAKPLSFTGPSMDDPSKIVTSHSIGLIMYDLTKTEVYTMRFQPGSFANWWTLIGQAMAAKKAGDMTTFFDRAINITSELVKGENRSWYVLKFQLGEKLDSLTFERAAAFHEEFQGYFNSTASDEAE